MDNIRFLKIFTFLSLDEIEDIRKQFEAAPHERLAQEVLARGVALVHGEEAYKSSQHRTNNSLEISKPFCQRTQTRTSWCFQTTILPSRQNTILNCSYLLVWLTQNAKPAKMFKNGAIYVSGDRIKTLTMSTMQIS